MEQMYCGCSDIGGVVVVTPNRKKDAEDYVVARFIRTGCDGIQKLNFLSKGEKVPEGYIRIVEGCFWLKIYNDDSLVKHLKAKEFNIYRFDKKDRYIFEVVE